MLEFQNRQIQLPDGTPVIVSRILGSIDGASVTQFEEKLLGFLQQGVQHLILVFSQVNYINSTGMGLLVKIADEFKEAGGDVSLIDVPDKLVALFNMLGLLTVVKLSGSEQEAIESFQKRRSQVSPTNNPISQINSPAPQINNPAITNPPQNTTPIKRQTASTPPPVAKTPPPPSPMANTAIKAAPQLKKKRKAYSKPVIIKCRKCAGKVSLGTRPKAGTYKCPRCMALFKLFPTGKITFS